MNAINEENEDAHSTNFSTRYLPKLRSREGRGILVSLLLRTMEVPGSSLDKNLGYPVNSSLVLQKNKSN
jgi:hypothetical protein